MKKNLLFLMLMASGGYAWAGRSEADLVKLDTSYGKTKDIIFEYNFNYNPYLENFWYIMLENRKIIAS